MLVVLLEESVLTLIVQAEDDGSLLLESKVQADTAYHKQCETLIVWSENDTTELALSFQERAGCDEIWAKICQVQGKDPQTTTITQEMDNEENEEEERFEDIPDAAMPIDLPPCEISRLFEVREVIEGAMNSPIRRERLAVALQSENYIPREGIHYWHYHMDSTSPIDVWVLNQTGVPHQLNTKTRSPSQQPPPPLPFPCSEPKPQPLVNGTSDNKPPTNLSDSIRSSIKHGNINYQPTRTNTFLNKTKSKEAKSRATPVTANHSLLDVRNTAPTNTSPVTRGRSALRKNKTYIPSSPVSHTSFVFQDLDPNIINGHKPSARLSPRRFYNEYPNENRVTVPPIPKPLPPPQPPYDKICGGDNEMTTKDEVRKRKRSDSTQPEILSKDVVFDSNRVKPYEPIPYCGDVRKDTDLRALFPISPTPMDHDYYFSMDNEEGLMDLFDISTTELF